MEKIMLINKSKRKQWFHIVSFLMLPCCLSVDKHRANAYSSLHNDDTYECIFLFVGKI